MVRARKIAISAFYTVRNVIFKIFFIQELYIDTVIDSRVIRCVCQDPCKMFLFYVVRYLGENRISRLESRSLQGLPSLQHL